MRLKSVLLFFSVLALSLSSCNNKILEEIGAKAVTGDALNVGFESVVLTGSASVSSSSTGDITIGVHYSLSEGMLPTNSEEEEADTFDKNYAFSIEIEGLDPETKYYYRTFVKERDVYTFGQTKSFTTTKTPVIKLSSESVSLSFMEQTGSFNVTIANPASGYTLIASSNDDWITDVVLSGNTVSYKVAANDSGKDRSGEIILSYGDMEEAFKITQSSTSLSISPSSAETDYTSKTLSFAYSIVNPVGGISLTATSEELWITDIKVSDATVSYKVEENNSGSQRSGKIKLTYAGIAKEFFVTQTYTAPEVSLTPTSQSTSSKSKTLSFTYSVVAPRQGVTASASSADAWIYGIQVNGNTVSYTVAENNYSVSRTGKITLMYASLTIDFPVYQEKASAPEPLCCEWSLTVDQMDLYKDFFGGTAGVTSQKEGFGLLSDGKTNFHVPSTIKAGGDIYYYQVDKTGMTPTSGNPKRIIGGTGDAYVTGAWPGDYWLITASNGYEYPAGTSVNVCYLTRVSATGHKYQILEYWDGQAWQPASPLLTETETSTELKYNFIESNENQEVNVTYKLAVPCKLMQFRMRCAANWQQGGNGALANPNGGTIRISERCKVQVL